METSAQYREYAAECYRLASVARTEEHRKILQEIARAWTKLAEEAEQTEIQLTCFRESLWLKTRHAITLERHPVSNSDIGRIPR
jgi:hypothetical protein